MYEYTASDGKRYRYDPQSGQYQQQTSEGWNPIQQGATTPQYTTEGWFDTPQQAGFPAPATPQATPGAATPQQHPAWWGTIFPGGGSPETDLQRAAYDLSPALAWSTAAHYFAPNTESNRYQWLAQHQNMFNQEYADYSTRHPNENVTLSQYIEQNAPGFNQRYDLQTPGQKGYALQWQPNGRFTG